MKIEGKRYIGKNGYIPLINGYSDLKLLNFGILRLRKGRRYRAILKNRETALVVLSGRIDLKCDRYRWASIGRRKDVFSGRAFALYVPPGFEYEIFAITDSEIAICSAPGNIKSVPRLIRPLDIRLRNVGKDNFRRKVYDIVDERIEAQTLLVGETINAPGNWSSYPPHKHDRDNLPEESDLEELYFFKLYPPDGFGVIRIYDRRKMDKIYVIRNNDVVTIPEGYHPVGVIPGYKIYYLWALAGKKRIMKPRDDPEYAWVKK